MVPTRCGPAPGAVRAWFGGLCLLAVAASGCGAEAARPEAKPAERERVLMLRDACPGVHVAYDALVAVDPVSARAFQESVRRLWKAGADETRSGVAPVLAAAGVLAGADRDSFPAARDGLYSAVARLSSTCASLGSPILH